MNIEPYTTVVSGTTPQENDPVLAAIDKAKWDDEDLDAFNILSNCDRSNALLGANRQIEAIRTAYLDSKQQPSHDVSPVWRETEFTVGMHCSCGQELLKWNYCPQCGAKLNWGDV